MKFIALTKSLTAQIDDEDWHMVSKFDWYADVGQWTTYAKTDQLPRRPRLHIYIMQPPKGMITHHRDGNGLNNCRYNLENVTQSHNARMSRIRLSKKGAAASFKGVYEHRPGKFVATITVNYKKIYIGIFDSPEAAALAYNKMATELLGEQFATNIIS